MRNPWSVATGVIIVLIGAALLVENFADVDVPWSWVLPALLVAAGIGLIFGRGDGGGGAPPSQFERDDAPRVP